MLAVLISYLYLIFPNLALFLFRNTNNDLKMKDNDRNIKPNIVGLL